MKWKKLASLALAGALTLGLLPALLSPALAADNVSTYTLQIPSTLTVSAAGWNETSGLTAAVTSGDTFDSGKKLSVTATSTNSWSLMSGSNSVGYNLATATGAYSSTATPASWEFSAAELNASGGTKKDMGIIVEDYSSKPAGTYQDTVTFTAAVNAVESLLTTITATGKEQASYSVANVATVSFSYTANGSSSYTNNGTTATWGWWGYGWIATVTPADGYTITKCVFYDDKDRTATDSEAPFVVETTEGDKTPQVNGTPILAYQSKGITKIEVYGYATH